MSNKLRFKIIHLSGYDDGFGGKELEIHSPITKGWQSPRFCIYPQEIILCLTEPALISKIQILSHQYNIASKIELFISMPSTPGTMSLVGSKFSRLGYVHLSTNEDTQHKARELKSVHVNAEGQLVKLIIHKNYVNELNLYNQVCLVALNILGQSLTNRYGEDLSMETDEFLNSYMNRVHVNESNLNLEPVDQHRYNEGHVISHLDDLSFDMYQDPETAKLIRKLDEKKRQAIQEERYEYAKKLKEAMADLHKVGEKLGRYEIEKRRAVEMENFDLAKSKKVISDEYRLLVYKQLEVFDLLELNKNEEKTDCNECHENVFESHSVNTPVKQQQQQTNDLELPPVQTTANRTPAPHLSHSIDVSTPSIPDTHFPQVTDHFTDRNDERPLPALKGKSKQDLTEHDNRVTAHSEVADQELRQLSQKEEREADLIIEVFGMKMAKQIYSKSWKHRLEAIVSISSQFSSTDIVPNEHNSKDICRACLKVLNKALQDQVYVILQNSVELFKYLLLTYIPHQSSLSKADSTYVLEKTIPLMLKRTGDSSVRCRCLITDTIIEIATHPQIKVLGVIPNLLADPTKINKHTPWRVLKSKIEILNALLNDTGIDKQSEFTTDRLMPVLTLGFEHPNNEVREVSLNCIIDVYKMVKDPIKLYFPPDQPTNRKNPLLCKLYDRFDKADGKLTENERKELSRKEKEDADQTKQAEIEALQAQLQDLRAAATQQIANNKNKSEDQKTNKNKSDPNKNYLKNSTKPKSQRELKDQLSVKKAKEQIKSSLKAKTPIKTDKPKTAIDRMCIFCNEVNTLFTEEGLDVHYWKSCPMLKRCDACMQVVEISSMSTHLTTECERKDEYLKCKICQIAVKKETEKDHIEGQQCKEIKSKDNHQPCLLCLQLLLDNDDEWKSHLLHSCKPNIERLTLGKENSPKKTESKTNSKRLINNRGGVSRTRGRGTVSKLPTLRKKK